VLHKPLVYDVFWSASLKPLRRKQGTQEEKDKKYTEPDTTYFPTNILSSVVLGEIVTRLKL
jgi:hypothetical protein